MEMIGGSSVVPRSHPLRPLVLYFFLIGVETGLLDYQGRAGIISIVQWNLPPVIFSVIAAAAKSRGCGDLRPWSLRVSCDFEANPKNR